MSIAVATGLVAGGAFTSYTTVYADEYNVRFFNHEKNIINAPSSYCTTTELTRHFFFLEQRNDERENDRRQYHGHHDNDDEDTRVMRFHHPPAEHHRFPNRHSLVANEEELLPGLLYVALAGLSGSLVVRQSKFAPSLVGLCCFTMSSFFFLYMFRIF